jgi:hypothetical protein
LAHAPAAGIDGQDPDGAMAFAFALFAMTTAGLIATDHTTHQRTGQSDRGVRHLLREAFAGLQKFGNGFVFHHIYERYIGSQLTVNQKTTFRKKNVPVGLMQGGQARIYDRKVQNSSLRTPKVAIRRC